MAIGAARREFSLLSPGRSLLNITSLFLFTPLSTSAMTTGAAFSSSRLRAPSSNSSPIVRFLSARGIRLTRISNRMRRLCACNEYWARSFRARSVISSCKLSMMAWRCACVMSFIVVIVVVVVAASLFAGLGSGVVCTAPSYILVGRVVAVG